MRKCQLILVATLGLLVSANTCQAAGVAAPAPAVIAPQQLPAGTPAQPSQAQGATGDEEDKPGPPSLFEEPRKETNFASIVVRIHTPHNQRAEDVFTLYPYPPKPPVATPASPLPFTGKALRNMILQTGYLMRPNLDKPYQSGGWRWVYAYKAGLVKSGQSEPHTLLSEYQWADEVAPYIARECILRNKFEEERYRRYKKALEDYDKHHIDAENEAIRLGLAPIPLSHREWSMGKAEFPPGTWWLQVTRKTPGLTYYWLQPLTVASNQHVELVLDENNALVIKGGW